MSTILKITVTKEILEKSKDCGYGGGPTPYNCAVALAVRDIFPRACVGGNFWSPDQCVFDSYILPAEAIGIINKFDLTEPDDRPNITPISFEIEIPDEVISQINIDEIRSLLINHQNLELVNL